MESHYQEVIISRHRRHIVIELPPFHFIFAAFIAAFSASFHSTLEV